MSSDTFQERTARAQPGFESLDAAIVRAREHLLGLQQEDGHWCAELEGDNILESEWVMLLFFLGRSHEPRFEMACNYLREQQLPDGGWPIFPGGPPDPNPSVKSYFALKLAGDDADAPHMRRARQAILECGGVEACNSFTKIFLAVFGQYEWDDAPAVPPELVRMPKWFPINLWEMSSWSRAIVVPLSIVWALKPHCPVPPGRGIDELRTFERSRPAPWMRQRGLRRKAWSMFFRAVDRGIKIADAAGLFKPWRRGSIERAMGWIEPRLEKSAGLAAIFPSILNVVVAYKAMGHDDEHPVVVSQMAELEALQIEERNTVRVQPCCSPVWDTALTLHALLESGLPSDHDTVKRAVRWLLEKEVTEPGDWRVKNPDGPVGGWYFEYANEFYPDCDDTAEVLAVLGKLQIEERTLHNRVRSAADRALGWQLSMQNRDGGWAAFDRECNKELLTLIPFADHNAMIDPSTADVTSRTVEALRAQRLPPTHEAVQRAVRFLERQQEDDGSWYGRWGSNYLYGTWLALCALGSVGRTAFGDDACPAARRAVEWLLGCQQAGGAWGETLESYEKPEFKGRGEPTSAQTAWAVLGLLAAGAPVGGEAEDPGATDALVARAARAVERGAGFLLEQQQADGSWVDLPWTGTGFPCVFYLRYHSYALYFPLQALASYRRELERSVASTSAHSPVGVA